MALSIIILAAGKGKRMHSALPKVMHKLGGKTLLEHVVHTAQSLDPNNIFLIYGNGGSMIRDALPDLPVKWIEQKELLGTGHAVMQALPHCNPEDQVLVLYGDVPLISTETLDRLLSETPLGGVGVLVAHYNDPTGFGRIIRDDQDHVIGIVEERDATDAQKAIHEINTGIVTAPAKLLQSCLPRVSNKNAQKEYYLTDAIALTVAEELPVLGVEVGNPFEVYGVNNPWQLATLERYYQRKQAKALALSGVNIMDAARLDVRGNVSVAPSSCLDVNVILEGEVSIGENCQIGPNVIIKNTTIGDNVRVLANSMIDGAVIENDCEVGPFARLRPGSVLKEGAKVGNFVEMKKSTLGAGSKASHLTYLGDAIIGKAVNVGAGTITCNYDGVNKWTTEIGDGAFIGSNTSLIAPVKIGKNATVAAGSAISKEAPDGQLTIARGKQQVVKGWKRPSKKEKV